MTALQRARDLGIQFGMLPCGQMNAITDVAGCASATDGHLRHCRRRYRGRSDRRDAIHPHEGSVFQRMVPMAIEVLNGSGEITGRSQVDEYGYIETPVLITNTFSVGAVHRAATEWLCDKEPTIGRGHFVIPVVAETYDGFLNDVRHQSVSAANVREALDSARGGMVAEGNVGGGTGMTLFGFKGGIGTASRIVDIDGDEFTVGVLVQGNTGRRSDMVVAGIPVGAEIPDLTPEPGPDGPGEGSIIVVIATDAPLSDRQCRRLCKRGIMGLGRIGLTAGNSSGDLLLAFSNNKEVRLDRNSGNAYVSTPRLDDRMMNPLFQATIEATSESVINAMVAAETMTGFNGNTVHAIPHDRLQALFATYPGRVI
ncbi:MAG: P1 family peptidase [Thermomicrobiales bacterium]